MKAYICNKCKLVVTNQDAMKKMHRLDFATDNIGKYDEKHLCDGCYKKIVNFINNEEGE